MTTLYVFFLFSSLVDSSPPLSAFSRESLSLSLSTSLFCGLSPHFHSSFTLAPYGWNAREHFAGNFIREGVVLGGNNGRGKVTLFSPNYLYSLINEIRSCLVWFFFFFKAGYHIHFGLITGSNLPLHALLQNSLISLLLLFYSFLYILFTLIDCYKVVVGWNF